MYAILDIESTGGQYNEEGIMEIAIYRFDGQEITDRFMSLVNPEREIQPFVAKLTGIHTKMLRTAPKFHEVAKRIIEITEGAILVAHNAQFDYRILRTEFRRLGYDFQRKTLCTVDLSKKLLPEAESHSLGKLVRSLGIPMSDRHRANGDALATLKLFKLLLTKDADKTILREVVRNAEHGELSSNQLRMVSELPAITGIYYMHNKEGEIIFLGKTKDIQKRVNQHFTNTGELARKLQKETKKVSFEPTGSELIAVLKEYAEVKKIRPKYNPISKKNVFTHAIRFSANGDGCIHLEIVQQKERFAKSLTFNGQSSARSFLEKMRTRYTVSPGNTTGFSFSGESKDVNGTRSTPNHLVVDGEIGREILEKYSLHQKNIALFDKGRRTGEQSFVLIMDGALKGYGYAELNHQMHQLTTLKSLLTPIQSDANTRYILESYLRKNNRFKIREITHTAQS